MKTIISSVIVLLLMACSGDDNINEPIACTEEFVYGLQVSVVDAVSGALIADGITVVAEDGDYGETLELFTDVYVGAGERAGTYTVTVFGDEYESAVVTPVVVVLTEDECHVVPQQLTVMLQEN